MDPLGSQCAALQQESYYIELDEGAVRLDWFIAVTLLPAAILDSPETLSLELSAMNESQTLHDRNLLFGILAVQMDFVSQAQLIETMQAWLLQKTKPLAQLLVDRKFLTEERRQLLASLVREHVRQHDNDPQQSLAAIGPDKGLRDELNSLRDPYVSRVISRLPVSSGERKAGEFLQTMPHTAPRETEAPRRYVPVRPLAEGGLGKVSVAMDTEVMREVALKEIKPFYADNIDSRARFLKEAEITGRLEHPGIVPVYGLGTNEDGRPYYAMRMITGCSLKEAIAEFHEQEKLRRDPGQRRLALRELLQRFIGVCHAVEFAHSRGILHRDLKPANVMLGNYRETLVVDWGLAKSIGETEATKHSYDTVIIPEHGSESVPTRMGEVVGTAGYMSPEQASGKIRELGPASDIYSLGATLYNLLTGTIPHGGSDLAEQLRNIVQGKFPKPREVNRSVSPVLESVCLKAMSLRPQDRYSSARALADDVEKYLADEPTIAHRDSWSERLARWERRNRTLVRTAGAFLLLVTILAVIFAVVFQKQKSWAQAQEKAAQEERKKAVKAEARSDKTLEILVSILKLPDPDQDGKSVTIYEALRAKAAQVPDLAAGDAALEAELSLAIGRTFLGLRLAEDAIPMLEIAHKGFIKANGEDYPDRLTLEGNMASAYSMANQPEKSLPLLQRNFELTREKFGPSDENTLAAMNNLAVGYQQAAQWTKSLELLEKSVELIRTKFGPENERTLAFLNNLASGYQAANQMDKALPLFEHNASMMRRIRKENDPNTEAALRNLAVAYQAAGQLDQGLEVAKEARDLRKKRLGENDLQTLRLQQLIADIYLEKQNHVQSESTIRDVLTRLAKIRPRPQDDINKALVVLAGAMLEEGKFSAAASEARKAFDYFEKKQVQSFERWQVQSLLGAALAGNKEFEKAETLLVQAFEQSKAQWATLQPTQRRYAIKMGERLASFYDQSNRPDRLAPIRAELDELKANR